jgi:hypothetical protein
MHVESECARRRLGSAGLLLQDACERSRIGSGLPTIHPVVTVDATPLIANKRIGDSVGQQVAEREFAFHLHDGEYVMAEERFFLIRVTDQSLSRDHWTPIEIEVMSDHHWWSLEELKTPTSIPGSSRNSCRKWKLFRASTIRVSWACSILA